MTHLCLGTNAEGLRDLGRPVELNHEKFLLLTSVSFESAIITCELERGTRERRANKKFEGRHERRAFEGRAAWPTPWLGG